MLRSPLSERSGNITNDINANELLKPSDWRVRTGLGSGKGATLSKFGQRLDDYFGASDLTNEQFDKNLSSVLADVGALKLAPRVSEPPTACLRRPPRHH
eukprot:1428089-Prymnesium_polylepis.1